MTSVPVVRCGVLLEQRYPRFEGSNLLSLHILVHTLSLQPTRAGALSGARSFGLSGFEWSDDKVVELGQDVGRKKVDLEFDLLSALGRGEYTLVTGVGPGKQVENTYIANLGNTFVDDLNHPLEFLAVESLDSLGKILLLLEGQHIIIARNGGALLASLLRVCRLL